METLHTVVNPPSMRPCALFLALIVTATLHAASEPNWSRLENCQLIQNEWNDGDSFHVKTPDGKEFIFRLYFVDAPETDARFPDRVTEQASALGISSEQALALGMNAKEFTAQKLGSGSFTVWTCCQDAMGSSKLPRWYAMIETKRGWLDQLVVKNGMARIYGKRITVPDGSDSRAYLDKLEKLKTSAKQ